MTEDRFGSVKVGPDLDRLNRAFTTQAIEAGFMPKEDFAKHVKACNHLMFTLDGYDNQTNAIGHYLATNGIDEFWREPIRVMAMGGYYYSADAWMAQHGEG